jgi:pimeloyl-ACP methyl ester carboxylesterase
MGGLRCRKWDSAALGAGEVSPDVRQCRSPQRSDMTSPPELRYTTSDKLSIAYQICPPNGPDLVYVSGWVSNLALMWDDPYQSSFIERLSSFSRLITFDKRGVGLSDRVSLAELPTLEQRMDDVRAVLDAAESESTYLFGHSEGSVMSALFAATYPERTAGLVLFGAFASRIPSMDYPWARDPLERRAEAEAIGDEWPDRESIEELAPSMVGNEDFIRTVQRYFRSAASPTAARALLEMNTQSDIRDILSSITVPTLLIHNIADRDAAIEGARYMAKAIPNARLVELDSSDHVPWTENAATILGEIEEFVTGTRNEPVLDRVLATVMFIDIVNSTATASAMGDAQWSKLLASHDEISRDLIERHRGHAIKSTGDGILATFDGPARAIRCAQVITERVRHLGLRIRSGLHTGEIEIRDNDIGGVGVHIASRVEETAGPDEIVVSRTVKDLVSGSGVEFRSRGVHELKGVPGEWELFTVSA